MTSRHFTATDAWEDARVLALIDEAARLKREDPRGGLEGRVLGMVFFNPSLRTRASFEVAMLRHGGHAVTIEPGKGVWGFELERGVVMDGDKAEHLVEAVRVLGRYVDALGVRAFPAGSSWEEAKRDAVLATFVEEAGVPVINMESARRHPCQGLADALTIRERFGDEARGRRFVLSWAWHPKALPTAVPASAALAAARLGMEVVVARPPGYALDPDDMAAIERVAAANGGRVTASEELDDAVAGADVVYAKSWGSLRHFGDPEAESALRAPHRSWCISTKHMNATRGGEGTFMHCLPVRRNVVVEEAVLESPRSAVTDQAENRLHAQRALLLELLGGKA